MSTPGEGDRLGSVKLGLQTALIRIQPLIPLFQHKIVKFVCILRIYRLILYKKMILKIVWF